MADLIVIPWFTALSEPPLVEPGLSAAWTQYHSGFFAPVYPKNDWFYAYAEPVRISPASRPTLQAALYQSFTTDLKLPPPDPALLNFWFNWFGEPVRFKPSLQNSLQLAFATDARWLVPAPPPLWFFNWLSEPVRSRAPEPIGSMPHLFEIVNLLSFRFAIVELGDVAVMTFGAFQPRHQANVTITEIGVATANVTISEITFSRGYS